MSLEYIKKDGSENGGSVADKINAIIDDVKSTSPELNGDLNGKGYAIYNTTLLKTEGLTLQVSSSTLLKVSLTADSTINFTDIPVKTCEWLVEVEANGYTITWPTGVVWDGIGSEPNWSDGKDMAYFYRIEGETTIYGMRTREGA